MKNAIRCWLAVSLLIATAVLTACGDDDPDPAATPDATAGASPAAASPTAVAYHLHVLTQTCRTEEASGIVIVEGTARNVGGQDLSGAIARASFLNAEQRLVASAEAPVSGDAASPGGIAAFRVTANDDPSITRCFVQFLGDDGTPLNVDYSRVRTEATPTR
jgi:hypothetical protein